jgi:hypothetical protein
MGDHPITLAAHHHATPQTISWPTSHIGFIPAYSMEHTGKATPKIKILMLCYIGHTRGLVKIAYPQDGLHRMYSIAGHNSSEYHSCMQAIVVPM